MAGDDNATPIGRARGLIAAGQEVPAMSASAFVRMSVVLSALVVAAPVGAAQIYKWVDERGVTNYSNEPPPAQAAGRTRPIENRLSVYTPDPLLARAIEAERTRAIEDLKTGRRAKEIHEDWLVRQYLAAGERHRFEPCPPGMDGRCPAYGPETYVPVFAGSFPVRPEARKFARETLTPGVTAGHVTAGASFIPGHSAFAPGVATRPTGVKQTGVPFTAAGRSAPGRRAR
jgi:hypothetical protein